ncbi:sterol desaturase family protein [Pseudobacteriovorax antillogorgiicola]|uniref:Beta-carotene 3-hydroxylase n=1 Tax=Pseudobacteriovorax antillogorgiicola TaxID=1513793 RepID=A0A1Y6BKR0_9BACT|nr:sterol desaturase family protein [Pseudobacteriovorax antillogorgiicola]TCS54700.1 beta-carotene 3-hydroxylase [Pseudobacteriovorax antillogorgiicola]SMF16323.1 beta-carotene 3-hydroxylase [Pseudobacteriovorax antillogorgiicola]
MEWWISFLFCFTAMEWVAWFLHKYVMHGFLWSLHEDHHVPPKDRKIQKNDSFALFFAVPSFFAILFGTIYQIDYLQGAGYGVTAYGLVYFIIHEVVIHRRWKFFNMSGPYIEAIRLAHHHHHQVQGKYGSFNFGMLLPPFVYFRLPPDELKRMQRDRIH